MYPQGHLAILQGQSRRGRLRGEDHRPQEPGDHRAGAGLRLGGGSAWTAILGEQIKPGDVVVIRDEGPKGGPGMREMLAPTSAPHRAGLGESVGLITDGRFSGGTGAWWWATSRRKPAVGGTIALVKDGDSITIDARTAADPAQRAEAEIATRRAEWKPPAPRTRAACSRKYAKLVSTASKGAVTD